MGGDCRTLLAGMAVSSGGFRISRYDPISGKFTLPPEQAMVFVSFANSDAVIDPFSSSAL